MFGKVFQFGGLLLLAGAAVLWTAGPAGAAGRGGFGGGHFGGGHFGGYHFGGYRGGYHFGYGRSYTYPHYGYHSYGYRPYYHHYGSGYPYYFGYYPNSYGYYPYDSSDLSGSGYDSGGVNYYDYYGPVGPSYLRITTPDTGEGAPAAGGTSAPAADAPAHVTAKVPAGARLWFDGVRTKSTGSVREFTTPPLTPGRNYHYDVRATWEENGHTVTQTRRVAVTPGANVRVDFPAPPGTAGQAGVTRAR